MNTTRPTYNYFNPTQTTATIKYGLCIGHLQIKKADIPCPLALFVENLAPIVTGKMDQVATLKSFQNRA